MSGHNKWSQIKEKKGKEDAKKSKIFSWHAKNISLESKKSAGDKNAPGLRSAIDRAKADNVPNDNIERAIERGLGVGSANLEAVIYEAFGPGGVALIIEGITDNKNRTTPEIKHLLSKLGGTLGGQGSAAWAFEKTDGLWQARSPVTLSPTDKEKLSALIQEIETHEDINQIYTNVTD